MYKQHLNTIVRFASQEVPEELDGLGEVHNISHILQKIESESRKKVNQERQKRKGKSSAPVKPSKPAWR